MRKHTGLLRLIAFMVVLAVMLSSAPLRPERSGYVTNAALAEENEVTDEEAAAEAARKAEEERKAAEEEAARKAEEERKAAEEEAARKAEEERKAAEEEAARKAEEEQKAAEEEAARKAAEEAEEQDKEEPEQSDHTVVTELETEAENRIEEIPEDDEDDGEPIDEDDDDDEGYFEFDDDEVGSVSEDLLQQFNNPESFEQVEFSGSADIELKNEDWDESWDGTVVLIAKVRDANLSYHLVWEANDHDSRGWFTVGSGTTYSYKLTKANMEREANREYRVVMFTVD